MPSSPLKAKQREFVKKKTPTGNRHKKSKIQGFDTHARNVATYSTRNLKANLTRLQVERNVLSPKAGNQSRSPARKNEQIKKGTKRGAAAIIEKEKEMENDTCVWGVRDRMESDVPASVLVAIVVSREGTKPQKKNGEKREQKRRVGLIRLRVYSDSDSFVFHC
ncbi:hypothetical protein V8G54_034449 [Vigna mungo]|uniref:Uncharacterized protein n=1 Tax=Vigna mungo TaxID=3915 RepID=A0AAQ3MQS6_VIGMU